VSRDFQEGKEVELGLVIISAFAQALSPELFQRRGPPVAVGVQASASTRAGSNEAAGLIRKPAAAASAIEGASPAPSSARRRGGGLGGLDHTRGKAESASGARSG
jgi:hypothetical protein